MDLVLQRCIWQVLASCAENEVSVSDGIAQGESISDLKNENTTEIDIEEENVRKRHKPSNTIEEKGEEEEISIDSVLVEDAVVIALGEAVKTKLASWGKKAHDYAAKNKRNSSNLIDMIQSLSIQETPPLQMIPFFQHIRSSIDELNRTPNQQTLEFPTGITTLHPRTLPPVLHNEMLQHERPAFMPTYLPEYPAPHTFVRTAVYCPIQTSYIKWRKESSVLNRSAELATINLYKRRGQMRSFTVKLLKGDKPLEALLWNMKSNQPINTQHLYLPYLFDDEASDKDSKQVEDEDFNPLNDVILENDPQVTACNEARVDVVMKLDE